MKKAKLLFIMTICLLFVLPSFTMAQEKHPITGPSQLTAHQMGDFVLLHNPSPKLIGVDIYQLAQLFIDIGRVEGIRGDMAFAQSIKETGYFRYGGDVVPEQNNYAGIGTVGGGVKGHFFESPEQGVRAQIHHLKAYATTEPTVTENQSPRFHLVTRGIAPNWEDLNGRWAVPGHGYGEDIVRIYNLMAEMAVTIPNVTLPSNHRHPVAKLHVRHDVPLLTPDREFHSMLQRGREYFIYNVVGHYYDLGGGFLVKSDSGKMSVRIGRVSIMNSTTPLYAPNGTIHRMLVRGENIRVFSYDAENYQVGGGFYIKRSDARTFYLGMTHILNDTPLYKPNGEIHRMLKKGEHYRTYKLDGNKLDLGGGFYVIDNRQTIRYSN